VICTPQFLDSNLTGSLSPRGPCSKLVSKNVGDLYSNLLTAEYTDTFVKYSTQINPLSLDEAIILLRGAITAAVELVPDNGPWIIHGDLHFGNVLVKKDIGFEPYTGIGDWGRTIIISDPKNAESIDNGLTKYLTQMSALFGPFDTFSSPNPIYKPMSRFPPIASGRQAQYSLTVLDSMQAVLAFIDDHNIIIKEGMARIRGWMVYVLLKQLYILYRQYPPFWIQSVLDQPSQEELRFLLNNGLPSIQGEPYLSKSYTATKVKSSKPPRSLINLVPSSGGNRKTRKN
jgi:hypothetical protein